MWRITDLAEGSLLDDEEGARAAAAGGRRIVLGIRFFVYRVRFEYYVGTPPSLGKEVLIVRQFDGSSAKDAALFRELLELFEE